MNEEEIIKTYKEQTANIQEALRLSGLDESAVQFKTLNLPDLQKMNPEQIQKFYTYIREVVVLYFNDNGFSEREISRRLGGHTRNMVQKILGKIKQDI